MTNSYFLINNQTGHARGPILWDGDTTRWSPPDGYTATLASTVDAGTLVFEDAPVVAAAVVPQLIDAIGLVGWLEEHGHLEAVRAFLDALPETTAEERTAKFKAKLVWERGRFFKRNNPILLAANTLLGLTESQLNDLFIQFPYTGN